MKTSHPSSGKRRLLHQQSVALIPNPTSNHNHKQTQRTLSPLLLNNQKSKERVSNLTTKIRTRSQTKRSITRSWTTKLHSGKTFISSRMSKFIGEQTQCSSEVLKKRQWPQKRLSAKRFKLRFLHILPPQKCKSSTKTKALHKC